MDKNIRELIEISQSFGKDKAYVIAGGGNTSYKNKEHIWIKSSGVALETIDENGFVCLSREMLKVVTHKSYSADSNKREAEVKDDLAAAIVSTGSRRPSVETSLHEVIDYQFVVHTHPTKVNGVMCSNNAKKVCRELFGDEALFIPYTDPGYILFKKVVAEIADFKSNKGYTPKMIFLENHGVFVAADSTEEIRSIYKTIMQKLDSRILVKLPSDLHQPLESVLIDKIKELNPGFVNLSAIGRTSDLIQHFVKDWDSFSKASISFSPDDIVYCKAHYLFLHKKNSDSELDRVCHTANCRIYQ